ncbi:MAG: hypothetical protein M3R24_36820, partial [Chloroflexota bacterium]|nr:hypothetical protein [Chloroflexota bacterium]
GDTYRRVTGEDSRTPPIQSTSPAHRQGLKLDPWRSRMTLVRPHHVTAHVAVPKLQLLKSALLLALLTLSGRTVSAYPLSQGLER